MEADVEVELAHERDGEPRREEHRNRDAGDRTDHRGDGRRDDERAAGDTPIGAEGAPRRQVRAARRDRAHERLSDERAGTDEHRECEEQQAGAFDAGDALQLTRAEEIAGVLDVDRLSGDPFDIVLQACEITGPATQVDELVDESDELVLVLGVEGARRRRVEVVAGGFRDADDAHALADRFGDAARERERELGRVRRWILDERERAADVQAEPVAHVLVDDDLVGPIRVRCASVDDDPVVRRRGLRRGRHERSVETLAIRREQERDHERIAASDFRQCVDPRARTDASNAASLARIAASGR